MRRADLAHYARVTRDRALTPDEEADVVRIVHNAAVRQRALPIRIVKLREKLRALEAELTFAQAQSLGLLQADVDQRRAARVERELARDHRFQPKGESENV